MRRSFFSASATVPILVLLLALASQAPALAAEASIEIQPNTLAMHSLGGTVSVHTDIDYSAGVPWTATLNGLRAYLVKSDLCGNLVAKFDLDAVKELASASGTTQLTLVFVATSNDGEEFTGTDSITVTRQLDRN